MKIDRFDQINEKKKNKPKPVGEYIWKTYLENNYRLTKIKEWESEGLDFSWYYFCHIFIKKDYNRVKSDVDSLNSADFKILLTTSEYVEKFGKMEVKHGEQTGEHKISISFDDKDKLEEFLDIIKYNL